MLEKALLMLEKAHLWHCYLIPHLGLEVRRGLKVRRGLTGSWEGVARGSHSAWS